MPCSRQKRLTVPKPYGLWVFKLTTSKYIHSFNQQTHVLYVVPAHLGADKHPYPQGVLL